MSRRLVFAALLALLGGAVAWVLLELWRDAQFERHAARVEREAFSDRDWSALDAALEHLAGVDDA